MTRIIIWDIAIYRLKMILDGDHRVDLYLQPLSLSHVVFYGDKVEKRLKLNRKNRQTLLRWYTTKLFLIFILIPI